jgi:purine-nucleoside phosphorylase
VGPPQAGGSVLSTQTDAEAAAAALGPHDVAVVLGSGWAAALERVPAATRDLSVTELPGFAPPTAEGHAGRVLSVLVGDRRVLAFVGRHHLYERRDVRAVAHAVRTAAAAGCTTVVLTNACGSMDDTMSPGSIVLISDHINMTGISPIEGSQFVDLTDLYSSRLRALCRTMDPSLPDGVYVGYWGPNYETPAEIRAFRVLGGDLVGMSTVLEAIAARAAGLEVLGLSLVTNRAAGLGGPLNHEEVLEVGRASGDRAGSLVAALLAHPELSSAG